MSSNIESQHDTALAVEASPASTSLTEAVPEHSTITAQAPAEASIVQQEELVNGSNAADEQEGTLISKEPVQQTSDASITETDSVLQAIAKLDANVANNNGSATTASDTETITATEITETIPFTITETAPVSTEESTSHGAETRSLSLREWLQTTVQQLRSDILPEITTRIMNDTTIATLRERASTWYSGLDDAAHRSINIFGGGMVAYVGALTLFGSGYMSGTLGVSGAATTAYYHLSHPHQA